MLDVTVEKTLFDLLITKLV